MKDLVPSCRFPARKIDRMRRIPGTVLLLGLVVLAGCEAGSSYGTSTRSASWSGNTGTPGIDVGTMASFKIWHGPADPVAFAVWSDLPSETGRSSSGPRGVSVEWRQYAPDGRSVEIRYEAAGGNPGTVEVTGRRFDPMKGALFLVRTDREPFQVEQMAFDLSSLPLDDAGNEDGATGFKNRADAIRTFVKSDPRVGDFFGMRAAGASELADRPAGESVRRRERSVRPRVGENDA